MPAVVGFSSSAGICLFHFAFYLNLGSKINAPARSKTPIHQQLASGKGSGGGGGEVTRAEASQRRPLTLSGSCYTIVLLVVISSL